MTEAELKAIYEEGKESILDELRWRRKVFAQKPKLLATKVAEMKRLLVIFAMLKDECKRHLEPSLEQPPLIDVPATRTEFK